MAQVLKHLYENIGEAGSLSSRNTLAQVTGVEKKLATEYLQKEPSYNRNHKVRGNHYRKTKGFSIAYITGRFFKSRRGSKT